MSRSSRPAPSAGNSKVLTIDWSLLFRRLKTRCGQLFTAARYRAGQTEYIPPAWMANFRLSWFRIGLAAIALFVFTQKQVDFTVSVGKEGIAAGTHAGRGGEQPQSTDAPAATQTSSLSMIPSLGESAPVRQQWSVDQYDAATVRAYINRFERVAKTEEEKFSIPAPAKMAMAILGSNGGKAPAAQKNNNHFGRVTTNGYYDNAWANWRAHSQLIQKDFSALANESVNYQQWIAALEQTNYSSDKTYGDKLIQIIERFGLDRL